MTYAMHPRQPASLPDGSTGTENIAVFQSQLLAEISDILDFTVAILDDILNFTHI